MMPGGTDKFCYRDPANRYTDVSNFVRTEDSWRNSRM